MPSLATQFRKIKIYFEKGFPYHHLPMLDDICKLGEEALGIPDIQSQE